MGWRRLAAGIAGAASVVALVLAVVLATAAGGSNGGYTVRADFDDAGNLIPGENVKFDGVKVGTVSTVTPTPEAKAAVVMSIENPGFQDFRDDASCEIRPQSLIGEKYVDCLPTQVRVEGAPLPPPLKKIPGGREGAGQYLLPVQNTSSPVDVDLLGDIQRLPERERFTLILNELGAGLAGRGSDLNEVVKRANPALRELDRVLEILANENHVLAKLAVDSDQALAPLAKVRGRVADFIVQANTVAQAGAATRGSLARNLALFPPFLEQLGPALERVQRFPNRRRRRSPASRSPRPGSTRRSRACPRSGRATKSSSKTSARPRRSPAPRSTACGRCSNAWKRSARQPSRSRTTSRSCSRACRKPAASSGSWTSSSSAPAPPTATTRSGTSCGPRLPPTPASPTPSRHPPMRAAGAAVQQPGQLDGQRG